MRHRSNRDDLTYETTGLLSMHRWSGSSGQCYLSVLGEDKYNEIFENVIKNGRSVYELNAHHWIWSPRYYHYTNRRLIIFLSQIYIQTYYYHNNYQHLLNFLIEFFL